MLGGRTPNIDRIAAEGSLMTDSYGQNSCTAGRAALITGQNPFRTGLLKVGLPAADEGIQASDPTLAEVLKTLGYATGQFGKNHLGDLNKYLPTVHGFDEFWGSLYHLNAMSEMYEEGYPRTEAFINVYGPRDILDCKSSPIDDRRVDPRWGAIGKQTIVDEGPLPPAPGLKSPPGVPPAKYNQQELEPVITGKSIDFITRNARLGKPFFLWMNPSRMHVWTNLKPYNPDAQGDEDAKGWGGRTGYGLYADGMAELDYNVGKILKTLDDLKIAENTIVIFTTDNGAEAFTWPDGGNPAPFHGEKGTTWEGGFRVPFVIRWPGVIKPGTITNDLLSFEDILPTLAAAAGENSIKEKLAKGMSLGDKTCKVYIDGFNLLPALASATSKQPFPWPRHAFFYFNDNSILCALRYDTDPPNMAWKISFQAYEEGTNLFTGVLKQQNIPQVISLRMDPGEIFERDAPSYVTWWNQKLWTLLPASTVVRQFMQTFVDYPPSQASGTGGKAGAAAGAGGTESKKVPAVEAGLESMQSDFDAMVSGSSGVGH
jgi:arylsulfatase A-like enzyme